MKIIRSLAAAALTAAMLTGIAGCAPKAAEEDITVRVGSLSGPTTIGIVNMMNETSGTSSNKYEYTVSTQPDEIAALLNAGQIDIALIPANLAAILYNRTDGGIKVIDINTYGVLYCLSSDPSITSVPDLQGKTVITTGQGATPEYAMRYLIDQYGVSDVTLDFKSEGTEVIAALHEDPSLIAVLPQPAATAAMVQNPDIAAAFSLDDAWNEVSSDSRLVTGVTVARTEFLEDHAECAANFLQDHNNSVILANTDIETTAQLLVDNGIVGAVPVAQRAIPLCNIVCVTGSEAKADLSGYLQTLYDANPGSVGGSLPGDDFYFMG